MKTNLLILILALGLINNANAKVFTVNNGTITAGQYTSVQAAVDAASAGDTIYIHGSVTNYGNVTLNKRLVLIGAGHKPTGTQYNLPTTLGTILLNQGGSTTLPAGSIIKGINCNYIYGSGGSLAVNNITIERSYIYSLSICGNGWIVRNNFISNIGIQNFGNLIISNNFLNLISSSDKPSVVIVNNIFLTGGYISSVSYAAIVNNIFMEPGILAHFNGTQNTYNKNIFIYADPVNYKIFPPANNTGAGNINTTNPQFISTIPLDVSQDNSRNYDWNLRSTSAGINYGTDGTDTGIYGGSYPMPNLTGVSNMPQMVTMDIQNSVIPENGSLNVDFKSRKQR
jgi:hypothetical protein